MDQIIHARLIEPMLPSNLVMNRPLIEELRRTVCNQRITFLHAPSGYGKTIAMCELGGILRQEGHSTSWLSIDSALSDPAQFWAHVHVSFGESAFCPGAEHDELASDGESLADILFQHREEVKGERFVFFDAFNRIGSLSLIDDFLRFCFEAPPEYHFVVSTREFFESFKAAAFKYGERVFEARDLTFALSEAEELIRDTCGSAFSDELIAEAYRDTEGWVQGIKLRAQAIARNETMGIKGPINGKNNLVRDYFICNILSDLPPDDVDFLIRISLFEKINRSLLAFVFGSVAAVERVDRLLAANAFIMNCDYEDEWYRLHPMFLDVLRYELKRFNMGELRGLCLNAAEWFHDSGYPDEAVKYLSMSGDLDYIEGLVEATSGLVRPDMSMDSFAWMCRVSAASVPTSPFLCLMAVWSCVTYARLEDADLWMGAFEELIESGVVTQETSPEMASFTMKCLSMKYLAMEGDGERALLLCEELQDGSWPITPSLLSMINQSQGEAYSYTGDYVQAMDYYLKAQASASVDQTIHQLVFNEYTNAVNLYYCGEHDKVERCCESLLKKCPPDFAIYGAACTLLARILIERDDVSRVPELLHVSENGLSCYRHIDLYLDIMTSHASWHLASGSSSTAFEVITEAVLQGEKYRNVPRAALLSAYFLQAQIALHRGDLNELQLIENKFALHLRKSDIFGILLFDAVRAFALRLQGGDAEVIELLDAMIERALERDFNRMAVIALVERTLILNDMGESALAITSLNELLRIARLHGYMRTILNGGAPMKQLLREYSTTRKLGGVLRTYVKDVLLHFEAESSDKREASDESTAFLESEYMLTAREIEVLRLLNMGLSRNEIAETLSISINTAKKHLSNIYAKMGVRNKTEALEGFTHGIGQREAD